MSELLIHVYVFIFLHPCQSRMYKISSGVAKPFWSTPVQFNHITAVECIAKVMHIAHTLLCFISQSNSPISASVVSLIFAYSLKFTNDTGPNYNHLYWLRTLILEQQKSVRLRKTSANFNKSLVIGINLSVAVIPHWIPVSSQGCLSHIAGKKRKSIHNFEHPLPLCGKHKNT